MTDSSSFLLSTIKPLRIIQFFAVLLLFMFVIFMTSLPVVPLPAVGCILLIVLSGIYVFITTLDIISQFGGASIRTTPMFIFSLLAVLFFAIASTLLIALSTSFEWIIITSLILCSLIALLFLIDILMVLSFWKRRCMCPKEMCPDGQLEISQGQQQDTAKHDLTTSVSSIRVPCVEGIDIPDHGFRKVGYARRRQYVDVPINAPSVCTLEMAQVQTEPRTVCVTECQTGEKLFKDAMVQTTSRCELCLQPFQNTQSSCRCPQQCNVCPTFVQLVRGGVGVTCCPSCQCSTGVIQLKNAQQIQDQRTRTDAYVRATPENANEVGQVASTSANKNQKSDTDSISTNLVTETLTKNLDNVDEKRQRSSASSS